MMESPLISWSEKRGLDTEKLVKLGVEVKEVGKNQTPAVLIPYRNQVGEKYGDKLRSVGDSFPNGSRFFFQPSGQKKHLWNIECLHDETLIDQPLVICEGEIDAISCIQAGFLRTVSIPDGWTNGMEGENPEQFKGEKMRPLLDALPNILRANEVIVAGDNDETGKSFIRAIYNLCEGLKVTYCKWPEGCKDPNDVLRQYGETALVESINARKVVNPKGGEITGFSDVPPYPQGTLYKPSEPNLANQLCFQTGAISILTGAPGHGKTTALVWVLDQIIREHDITVGAMFMEATPNEVADHLCRLHKGKPLSNAIELQKKQLFKNLDRNWKLLHRNMEDVSHSMDWLRQMIRDSAVIHQCRIIVIDPWNELEHMPLAGESMANYANAALSAIRKWAQIYDVHIIVVAHPRKVQNQDGSPRRAKGYDVADCHDEKTEVLTKRGWLPHADVSRTDSVACFDLNTQNIEYQNPDEIIQSKYKGTMHLYEGKRYSACVTPNHRMVVMPNWIEPVGSDGRTGRPRRWVKGEWSFVASSEITRAEFSIPNAGLLNDLREADKVLIDKAKLLGFWLSEGWKQSSGVGLCQNEGAVHDDMVETMERLKIDYSQRVQTYENRRREYKPTTKWYIGRRNNREIVDWLRGCGEGCDTKRIPSEAFGWPLAAKFALLEAFIDGDGSRSSTGHTRACTTSRVLADQLMIIAIELGRSVSISERNWPIGSKNKPSWTIYIGCEDRPNATMNISRNRTEVEYDGPIYCLKVPTGAYVTRRNGKVQITGNSAAFNNKPALGWTVFKDETDGCVEFIRWKCRQLELYDTPNEVTKWIFDPYFKSYKNIYEQQGAA